MNTIGESNFTIGHLEMIKIARYQKPFIFRESFVRADIEQRLKKEIPAVSIPGAEFFGMKVFVKPGQKAQCWMIGDPEISRKYLNDEITEDDLIEMASRTDGKIAAAKEEP